MRLRFRVALVEFIFHTNDLIVLLYLSVKALCCKVLIHYRQLCIYVYVYVLSIRKAAWHWFVDACLCICLCMVNTSGDVCFCWKPYIHLNRQVNPGNWQRCGCSVRTLPFDHFVIPSLHSHWINADNTANVLMGDHLQLSKGESEEVFQCEEGEIQSRVQLCPAVLSGPGLTMWARDASARQTRGETGERGGNTLKVFLHFPLWLGATCKCGQRPWAVAPKLCWTTESSPQRLTQTQSGKDGSTCAED